MFYSLPRELQQKIYEWDPTYRYKFDLVMHQLRRYFRLYVEFAVLQFYPDNRLSRIMKMMALRSSKKELRSFSTFMKVRIPKKTTKYRLTHRLFCSITGRNYYQHNVILQEEGGHL